jgi:hypothetical protein
MRRKIATLGWVLAIAASAFGLTTTSTAAADADAESSACSGWGIRSASPVRNVADSSIVYGAVQLLRRTCPAPDDYYEYAGRLITYGDLGAGRKGVARLFSTKGSEWYCSFGAGGSICTTRSLTYEFDQEVAVQVCATLQHNEYGPWKVFAKGCTARVI